MKGKHLHEPCLFVCVGRLMFPALIFSGPGFCLLYPLCTDEVPEGARGTECLPLFIIFFTIFWSSAIMVSLSRSFGMPTWNQKGLSPCCRRQEAELPGYASACCWANWHILCFPLSVTVCCQKRGSVSWLLIGTYCILPVNSAVDFLIYSMWLASADQTLQAKKNPMEHMAPLSNSLFCSLGLSEPSLRYGLGWCVCVPGRAILL